MPLDQSAFDWPVAVYLTLAGVAAGAALAAVFLLGRASVCERTTGRDALAVSLVAALIGAACLILDLEGPQRFWIIFAYANPSSAIGWGVRILSLFVLSTAAATAVLRVSDDRATLPCAMRGGLALCALALAIYPGFVLRQASGAALLWRSPWLIPLFSLSGLHTGLSSVGFLRGGAKWIHSPKPRAAEFAMLIALTVLLLLFSLDPFVLVAALFGGVLLPLAMLLLDTDKIRARCTLVLLGGAALRLWTVLAAQGPGGLH